MESIAGFALCGWLSFRHLERDMREAGSGIWRGFRDVRRIRLKELRQLLEVLDERSGAGSAYGVGCSGSSSKAQGCRDDGAAEATDGSGAGVLQEVHGG